MRGQLMLRRGRKMAGERHSEEVVVGMFKNITGPDLKPVRSLIEEHYSGSARIKWSTQNVSRRDQVGQSPAVQTPSLHVAVGAFLIREGDEVEVVSSSADESLVARRFTVNAFPESGQVTNHRFPLTEVS